MQVGGVQDATIVAAVPGVDPVATPEVVTEIDAGAEELQVSGTVTCDAGAIMMFPAMSVTVGAKVCEVDVASINCIWMDSTRQVVKSTGGLFAVPMAA